MTAAISAAVSAVVAIAVAVDVVAVDTVNAVAVNAVAASSADALLLLWMRLLLLLGKTVLMSRANRRRESLG